ncbi:MAG TPA: M14 family zinc carboxypeptidase [Vicinamibacterales bacterium]|nr:M14 family zinc carboxypeptidase [Vicinamibacterales bacterium]
MRNGTRRAFTAALLAGGILAATLAVEARRQGARAPAAPAAWDLSAVFRPGAIFQDRNGDGVIDFVSARIVIGDAAAGDVAAAADVAARLGFETAAMNLPLTAVPASAETVPIVIGAAGLAKAGEPALAGAGAPVAGEGVVFARRVGGQNGVVIAGGDAAGTRAAAEAFAGRLPRAWDPQGATLAEVAEAVRARLAGAGLAVSAVTVPEVRVRAGAEALTRAVVEASVGAAEDAARLRSAHLTAADPLTFPGIETIGVRVSTAGGRPVEIDVPRARAPERGPMPARAAPAKPRLSLGTLFTSDGFFADTDTNLIPDRLDVLLSPSGPGTEGTIDLAARLGLESAGIAIPAAEPPDALGAPESRPTLVLIGVTHPLIERLATEGKLARPALAPGEGWIGIVPRAFGAKSAVVVTGADARGLGRALAEMAEKFPNIWARGKDRTTIAGIEEGMRQFLGARSPAGQAATALYKLDQVLDTVAAQKPVTARVVVSLEKIEAGLKPMIEEAARRKLPGAAVEVALDNRDVQHASTIFTDDWNVPSEVDDFWQAFRGKVLPAVVKGQPVVVDGRLNEPPAIRRAIEQEALAALVKAGAAPQGSRVTVISAYKQGFSWLDEVVGPAVAGQAIDRITLRFAEMGPPPGWPQGTLFAPTRWLLEAFPIDEVLARELKIDASRVVFEEAPIGAPAYEVTVTAPGGARIYHATFDPKVVVRPYFDVFPEYEKVRITTGWIQAAAAGRVVVDQRIATDTERVWDRYQSKTLPALYDYVMKLHAGKPRQGDAPYFGELTIDASLSEPDYEIGIDKEQMMSMETLHEDLYFTTIEFFRVLGRFTRGQTLDFPGRIIPVMHPRGDGRPGHVRTTFTGFAAPRPGIRVEYAAADGRRRVETIDVPKVQVEAPAAWAARVRDGQDGLAELDLRVKVDSDRDERARLITRQAEDRIDARMLSAEEVTAVVANLGKLRAAGLYRDALAFHDVGLLRISAGWTFDARGGAERTAALEPNGAPEPWPDIRQRLPAGYAHAAGAPIVQWDTPIPPPEAAELLAKMSTFPEASVYKVGTSYLGKDIWAMDLLPPVQASHWSQAKMSTLKPTVIYSGRQHANEVSSTSHVLKLAELLLTDPAFRKKLDKVNVVIHPITNPDGAQLAYDLYKITPDYSLHAGYLASLGADVTAGQWDEDRIYPEAGVRPKLWRTWAPDIFLNPHGYPTHMWVQPFSEFIGPVRNGRVTEERHWGIIRGWFMPSFNYIDDPRYPYHKQAAFAIRDRIWAYIQNATGAIEMNKRAWARYRKYGLAFDNDDFKDEDFSHNAVIYTDPKGSRGAGGGGGGQGDFMARQPNVTIWSGTTEAPDETAYGGYLKMIAAIGLEWDKANLDYLFEGAHRVDRKAEAFFGGVAMTVSRERPARPANESKTSGK